jgi:uncharacterized membrane protein YphA (DoxX/SURF4 family)
MKRDKIIYWISTGLIAAGFLMSSVMYFSRNPELMENFKKLGFPIYFLYILGTAKFLGALAIVNPWFPKLKEWAYAGFAFVLIGAVWVHIATATPFAGALIFLALTGISYVFNERAKLGSHAIA